MVNHIKYDSYGNVISESNPALKTRYKYTGREFDAETELQYNRARYYDAAIGRFIAEDPIGLMDGVNTYVYVRNQPQQSTDPSGLLGQGDIEWREMGQPKGTPPEGNSNWLPDGPVIKPQVPDKQYGNYGRQAIPSGRNLGSAFSGLNDAIGRLPNLPDGSNDLAKGAIGLGVGIGAAALGGPAAAAAARGAAATLGKAAGPAALGAFGAAAPAFAAPDDKATGAAKGKKKKC